MTTTGREAQIACRIAQDLHDDLEAVRDAHRDLDLSTTIRRLLRAGADRELGRTAPPAASVGLFGPRARRGASHRRDRPTSRHAAVDNAPRAGTQRHRLLAYIAGAGDRGLTYDEANALDERAGIRVAGVGLARRASELLEAGAIAEAYTAPGQLQPIPGGTDLLTRKTRNGSEAAAYIITDRGRRWLQELDQA